MVINDYRNKPFGPGGGTRRLHQMPALSKGAVSPVGYLTQDRREHLMGAK